MPEKQKKLAQDSTDDSKETMRDQPARLEKESLKKPPAALPPILLADGKSTYQKINFSPITRWGLESRLKVSVPLVPEKADSLIDLACGEGYFLAALEKRFPSMKLTGVDLSKENLARANNMLERTRLLRQDISRLNMPAASFDAVSLMEVIEHFEDGGKLLSEANRLLKPHGTLIISTPDTEKLFWRFTWKIWTNTTRRNLGEHVSNYTERDMIKLLEESGFKVKREARAIFGCIMAFECEKVEKSKQS